MELECFSGLISTGGYTLIFPNSIYASALGSSEIDEMVNDVICPEGTPVDGLYFQTEVVINGNPTYRTGNSVISFDNEVPVF